MRLLKKDLTIDARLSVDERVAYGAGNLGSGLAGVGLSVFLLYYFTNYVGLNAGIVGTIILVSKVLDGISDLIMGRIVDCTHTKNGKARPWILRICVPYAISTILLFAVPGDGATLGQYIWVFVTYNLFNTVFCTMMSVPYNSLTCLITQNQYERGILGIFSMYGLVVAQFLGNGLTISMVQFFGNTRMAWTITYTIYACIGLVCQLFCYFNTRERVSANQKINKDEDKNDASMIESIKYLFKNKYWVKFAVIEVLVMLLSGFFSASITYYAQYVLGNVNMQATITNIVLMSQLVFMAISFIFIKKIGKVGSVKFGSILMGSGYLIILLSKSNVMGIMIGCILAGAGNGIAAAPMNGICADTVEYGEWKFGVRSEGMAFAAISMAQKLGAGIGTAVIGWILVAGGFDAALEVQSSTAQFAIKLCTLILPVIFLACIVIITFSFKLEKEFPTIMQDLKNRREANDSKAE